MGKYIELENIELTYQSKYQRVDLFHNLNLSFEDNEYAVILGRSGSGKSSILNLIAGVLTPTNGKIMIQNKDISKYNDKQMNEYRNAKLGYIFQFFNLINQFTVLENIMVPLLISGLNKKEAKKNAIELLKQVELEDRKNHFPYELSGGEQQRVCIARALANNPDIILADEPTGNLDIETGKTILKLLDNIHKQGKTVILVTHNVDIAECATKVVKMEELLH